MIINITERIKELRESLGLTQSELANALNISRSAVNAWEMGSSKPSIDTLVDLADYFHVSTDYILGRTDCRLIEISGIDRKGSDILLRLTQYFAELNSEKRD